MQTKKRHIFFIVIFSTTVFLAYSQDKISAKQKNKPCFCDSITENKRTDTLSEYICYKENTIYKLQFKDHYEKISKVRNNDNRKVLEVYEKHINDSSKHTYRHYLNISSNKRDFLLKLNGEDVDSLEIIVFNSTDTLLFKYFKGNIASIPKSLCANSENRITVIGHVTISEEVPGFPGTNDEVGMPDMTYTQRYIFELVPVISLSFLVKYPLDKVLLQIKNCIDGS